jgi:hypothetical protein
MVLELEVGRVKLSLVLELEEDWVVEAWMEFEPEVDWEDIWEVLELEVDCEVELCELLEFEVGWELELCVELELKEDCVVGLCEELVLWLVLELVLVSFELEVSCVGLCKLLELEADCVVVVWDVAVVLEIDIGAMLILTISVLERVELVCETTKLLGSVFIALEEETVGEYWLLLLELAFTELCDELEDDGPASLRLLLLDTLIWVAAIVEVFETAVVALELNDWENSLLFEIELEIEDEVILPEIELETDVEVGVAEVLELQVEPVHDDAVADVEVLHSEPLHDDVVEAEVVLLDAEELLWVVDEVVEELNVLELVL